MKLRDIDEIVLVVICFRGVIFLKEVWNITKKVLRSDYSSDFNFYKATRYSANKLMKNGLINICNTLCSFTSEGLDIAKDIVKDWKNSEIILSRFDEIVSELDY